ncbi:MAG: hypothetical protein L6R38_005351 [Xanthoria sp. 2 TBL-2021]|nr:MAG: hypothetical protein L6R38_005351 [Xanthoria sp. 2 TBL-2021]
MYTNLLIKNTRICCNGSLIDKDELYVNGVTGLFENSLTDSEGNTDLKTIDMENHIIAPAFIELQTNGCLGMHFTNFEDEGGYRANLEIVSRYLVEKGVGGFYVTLPTVKADIFKKILPQLKPREFDDGAGLLGAHCEGPWLNPSKKGAHDASLMQIPSRTSIEQLYGDDDSVSAIRLVTLAPELDGSTKLIEELTRGHNIRVSLGHSAADFDTGLAALKAGATTMTHVFNAMNPLHHRSPGLAGLMVSEESPYFSLIADGIHLHAATLAMAFHANPQKCILITDSVEMVGLADGLYPGHAQIPHQQRKQGNRVTIEGTDTLIGSCSSLDECIRNLTQWSGCSLAQAVQCATENIARMMGLKDRGVIEMGRRADFVVLDDTGRVLETWIGGKAMYQKA